MGKVKTESLVSELSLSGYRDQQVTWNSSTPMECPFEEGFAGFWAAYLRSKSPLTDMFWKQCFFAPKWPLRTRYRARLRTHYCAGLRTHCTYLYRVLHRTQRLPTLTVAMLSTDHKGGSRCVTKIRIRFFSDSGSWTGYYLPIKHNSNFLSTFVATIELSNIGLFSKSSWQGRSLSETNKRK